MKNYPPVIAAFAATAALLSGVFAAPIPDLYPTGVNDAGALLGAGAVDPHYTLVSSADAGADGPQAYVVNDGFPIGTWLANGPDSKWIAPQAAQGSGNAEGDYTYRISFDLDGLLPDTAAISGRWSSDNAGTGILLNGTVTGNTHSGAFTTFESFTVDSGFVAGINTLDFVVNNAPSSDNPTGVRVELSGTAEVEQPPGTPPSIVTDPADVAALIGGSASFTVAASGALPLSYQWRRNGVSLAGAHAAALHIAAVSASDAGSYDVVVSNPWGTATSAPALLAVSLDLPTDEELAREQPGPSRRRSGFAFSEIMYHPRARGDGSDLEFIEIYNANPWPEPVGGYRIEGEVVFEFAADAQIAANGFIVVAAVPADVSAEYGLGGVRGPWTGALPNAGGSLRLVKRSGGVVLDMDYDDAFPWPVAADGAGHSLILARASFGEDDARAWSDSARIGGSPGADESPPGSALEHVFINEILADPAPGAQQFVELHNRSFAEIDLSGCILTNDPDIDLFVIPGGTTIVAGGFASFDAGVLGFALSSAGETVYFKNPAATRVVDAIRFGGQAPETSFGRQPDGNPDRIGELSVPTPGAGNVAPLVRDVVINEIMYHPIDSAASEYVELFNRSAQALDIGGWAFVDGIDFSFPAGSTIAPGGYVVVARDRARLLADHPGLGGATVLGDFGGSLSDRGERIALAQPVLLDGGGVTFADVDEVTYADGGRWGRLADGGGSSLELADPGSDNRHASNWATSDESTKAPWTTIEHSGTLELGKGTADQLQLFLLGEGEALVDDVEVVPEGGSNRVTNSTFSGPTNWFFQGTHRPSTIEGGSLHLRAVKRGDLGSNRIRTPLSAALADGSVATIRARARWLGGHPEVLFRLLGNYLEVPATLDVPGNLGTPGAVNSVLVANAPPAIDHVRHLPVLPAPNEAVRIAARAEDSDGLASLTLVYRIDPSASSTQVTMRDDGTGGDLVTGDRIFTAVIPGQPDGTLVAFHIEATDAHPGGAATGRFPEGAPDREGLILWGDGDYAGGIANYRIWMTRATRDTWEAREKMSNEPLGVTFVYDDQRVVYGAGAYYSGSAYTSPGYNSPTGKVCGYDLAFPRDEMVLGDDRLILDFPVRDPTAQREQLMYWFCDQSGLPNNYRRYVNVFVNGIGQRQRSGWGGNSNAIYTDIQQPNSDTVKEWFRGETGGHLVKGSYWHEFDNGGARINPATVPTLQIYNGSGGAKSVPRYRWNWRLRAVQGSANDYSEIFDLVDAMNAPGDALIPAAHAVVDIDQWMRTFVVNDLAANWDSFGNPGGKNTFHYKPPGGRWQLMSWDFDVGLGVFNNPVNAALFDLSDPIVQRLYTTPELAHHYWHAMREAVDTFFQRSAVAPVLDSKWAALQAAGVPVTSPNVPSGQEGLSIPNWIDQRRQFLLQQLSSVEATFQITTNGGAGFSTPDSLIELRGTSPMSVHQLFLDGAPVPVEWQGVNVWSLTIARDPGVHPLSIEGRDRSGNPIAGASDGITVTVTGGGDAPIGNLVINEIMYHPAVAGSEFLEFHNRSATTAFDLGGWRVNGLGFIFSPGSVIAPGGYVVLAEDAQAFGAEYGWEIPLAGVYPGSLDNAGEAISLLQPGTGGGEDIEVDRVRYSPVPPWPAGADGAGASLQLIDPSRDNARASNWSAPEPEAGEPDVLLPMTADWRYNQGGFVPVDWNQPGFVDNAWSSGDALLYVESADLPATKNTPLSLGPVTYYFRTTFNYAGPGGGSSLELSTIIDDGAVVYLNGDEILRMRLPDGPISSSTFASPFVSDATLEGPFVVPTPGLVVGENVLAVEVHQSVSNSSDIVMGLEVVDSGRTGLASTPGAQNLVPAGSNPNVPPLWLNELRPVNADGATDNIGEAEPWVELFNAGGTPVPLDGWFLSNDINQLAMWAFSPAGSIAGGGFAVVWLDGETGENTATDWHASFVPGAGTGSVFLAFQPPGQNAVLVDALSFADLPDDRSLGHFPDGSPELPQAFVLPTPGAPNDNSVPLPAVTINEWMASNNGTLADPADGDFDDWFELHNAGGSAVDLSGFTLTDDLVNPDKFTIPSGVVLAGGGFLLVWADEESSQTQPGGDLHVNFKLAASGEAIGLFAPDGSLVDSVVFGAQAEDVSEGRWPDGAAGGTFNPQSVPTPRGMNDLAPSGPPLIPELAIAWNVAGDSLRLAFTTEFGRYYLVQNSTDLRPESWEDLSAPIGGTGGVVEFALAAPLGTRQFYRVAIVESP